MINVHNHWETSALRIQVGDTSFWCVQSSPASSLSSIDEVSPKWDHCVVYHLSLLSYLQMNTAQGQGYWSSIQDLGDLSLMYVASKPHKLY